MSDDKQKELFPGNYNCVRFNVRGTIILASIYNFRNSLPLIVTIACKIGVSEEIIKKTIHLTEIHPGDKIIELPFEWYLDYNPTHVHEYLDKISVSKHPDCAKISDCDCIDYIFQLYEKPDG